ncbi:hypothetical protein BX265_5214 [Streptomyces sp. TLI_235]|nr:hypothetical protein [Streptomyces sp. TLI_235]PBC70662.1 hypothetical protein BX265_5214 [Streptomyces sp. TLI_235]
MTWRLLVPQTARPAVAAGTAKGLAAADNPLTDRDCVILGAILSCAAAVGWPLVLIYMIRSGLEDRRRQRPDAGAGPARLRTRPAPTGTSPDTPGSTTPGN